jgi:hypothetical protein
MALCVNSIIIFVGSFRIHVNTMAIALIWSIIISALVHGAIAVRIAHWMMKCVYISLMLRSATTMVLVSQMIPTVGTVIVLKTLMAPTVNTMKMSVAVLRTYVCLEKEYVRIMVIAQIVPIVLYAHVHRDMVDLSVRKTWICVCTMKTYV